MRVWHDTNDSKFSLFGNLVEKCETGCLEPDDRLKETQDLSPAENKIDYSNRTLNEKALSMYLEVLHILFVLEHQSAD